MVQKYKIYFYVFKVCCRNFILDTSFTKKRYLKSLINIRDFEIIFLFTQFSSTGTIFGKLKDWDSKTNLIV